MALSYQRQIDGMYPGTVHTDDPNSAVICTMPWAISQNQTSIDDYGRLFAAAPDLLAACRAIDARISGVWDDPDLMAYGALHTNAETDCAAIARKAVAKAQGAPTGWTHAETHAPDSLPFRTPAARAVEQHIADAQKDLPLPELLAAILRRAERGRSYGKLMITSKDICLDDVIRLATAALLLANDQHNAADPIEGADRGYGPVS